MDQQVDERFDLSIGEIKTIKVVQDKIYALNKHMGWHERPREDGTILALIHSEISEALEGVRKDTYDDHIPTRKTVEVELADAVIRILDFAGKKNLDIAGAMAEKIFYNRHREDHKLVNRMKEGGKQF